MELSQSFTTLYSWIGFQPSTYCLSKSAKIEKFSFISQTESDAFLGLLGNETIFRFLEMDRCNTIADKYLIASVFLYFKRAQFTINEFTPHNFFLALYLAHDMEEDFENWKDDILPHALGRKWRQIRIKFLIERDMLWKRMDYRALSSRKSCDAVMKMISPSHPVWKRQRANHHIGAIRIYQREPQELHPTGIYPHYRFCKSCCVSKDA